MSERKLTVAVVGMGEIGRLHAANVLNSNHMTLLAVASRSHDNAAAAAEQLGGGIAAMTVDEALADSSIDAMVITSQTADHVHDATRALERGRHIFLEKPGADSLAAHTRLTDCAARSRAIVATGYARRYDPEFRALKAKVQSGAIGTPYLVNLVARERTVPDSDLRTAAGFIVDLGVHDFDIATWMLEQEPVEAYATVQRAKHKHLAFDSAVILVRFDRGGIATVHLSANSVAGHDIRCEVIGTLGSVALNGLADEVGSLTTLDAGVAERSPRDYTERFRAALASELDAFANRCLGLSEDGPGLNVDGRALAVGVAARASAEARKPLAVGVDWPWFGPM